MLLFLILNITEVKMEFHFQGRRVELSLSGDFSCIYSFRTRIIVCAIIAARFMKGNHYHGNES